MSIPSSPLTTISQFQLKKLKQQNIQLYKQIFQLQTQVNQVLSRQQTKKLKNLQLEKQLTSLYGQQLDQQQKKIKKLKQQVYYLKSSNAKLNLEYLNKQEDHLSILYNERDQLVREKELLKNSIIDKKQFLNSKNNGLQTHKIALETQYTETKKSNNKKLAEIVQIQRELRKYHFIAETVKNQSSKPVNNSSIDTTNLEMQFQQIVHQISKTQREIKEIQDKWKPAIETLDNEFFTLSAQEKEKKKNVQKLLKQFKIIEHRSRSLRDESEIVQDRNRLSKIVTSSSLGFSQTFEKKNKFTQDLQVFIPQSKEKKQRISSDFILKELQNLKVKREKRQIANKTQNILQNQNKTFDQGAKAQPIISFKKQKSTKIENRSFTQAELSKRQKIDKVKISPADKYTQLKISYKQKEKIIKKSPISSSLNLIVSPSEQHLEKKEKKDSNLKSQRKKYQDKSVKQQNKITQQQKIVVQSPKNKQSPTEGIFQTKNSQVQKNQKNLEQKISKKGFTINEETALAKENSSEKSKISEKKNLKQKSKHDQAKNNELKHGIEVKSEDAKPIQKKNQKITKELKESIKLKEKRVNQERLTKDKVEKNTSKRTSLQTKSPQKQSQMFQIRLENKKNSTNEQKISQSANQPSPKLSKKSIEASNKKEQQPPKETNTSNQINSLMILNQEAKLEATEQFKPYLIKRKRQGGALNFQQSKEQQSKQKANLLSLIEKQSIGVGIQ